VSVLFDGAWAAALVSSSGFAAARLLAVPVGPLISLVAGGIGVGAGAAAQQLPGLGSGGVSAGAAFARTSFMVMLTAVAVSGLVARAGQGVPGGVPAGGVPRPLRGARVRRSRQLRIKPAWGGSAGRQGGSSSSLGDCRVAPGL